MNCYKTSKSTFLAHKDPVKMRVMHAKKSRRLGWAQHVGRTRGIPRKEYLVTGLVNGIIGPGQGVRCSEAYLVTTATKAVVVV